MFRKILVPLDDSELSPRVLQTATSIAERFGADLVLLFVRDHPAEFVGDAFERDLREIDEKVGRMLALARPHLGDLPESRVTAEVRAGALAEAIVNASEDLMVDLVVMGTHGRQGLADAVAGSTTERVAARTTASVLMVKPEGFPYLRE